MSIIFIEVDNVIRIHDKLINKYGGSTGLRDITLLESAIGHIQMVNQYGENDIYVLAAHYLYHIAKNHAFIDGNKRAGLGACLTFLEVNSIVIDADFESLYFLSIKVADSSIDKPEIASFFRSLSVGS